MNSPERINQLLPWVNGDPMTVTAVRRKLFAFLHKFETTGLSVRRDMGLWELDDASASELEATRRKLVQLFESVFVFDDDRPQPAGLEDIGPDDTLPLMTGPSLCFGVRRVVRGKQSRRNFLAHGTYTLVVNGSRLRDLVTFLSMYLLTTKGVVVSRCAAPRFRDYRNYCNRLFIWTGTGRPAKVCCQECGNRVKAKVKKEKAKHGRAEDAAWLAQKDRLLKKGKKR